MVFVVLLLLFVVYKVFRKLYCSEQDPVYSGYEEGWFGKDDPPTKDDTSIRPFEISVSDSVLKDLQTRLDRTRLEEPLQDSKFHYGFNTHHLKTILEYWKTGFDWRRQEAELNKYPHFKTRIEGIDVHFVHVKPSLPEGSKMAVLPIMLVHGWPGSFVEFYKIIPLLTAPKDGCDFVFEVICPSIPGYGFSESSYRKGLDASATARMFVCLMGRLGHTKYYLQGGDWGSLITSYIARYYPEKVLGIHLNMFSASLRGWNLVKYLLVATFPFLISSEEYNSCLPIRKKLQMIIQESGYLHIQGTKPDTVGCAMSDSPIGMAAYILEKFVGWTDRKGLDFEDGLLTSKFTLDELLTNVMVYWVNNNFAASARFYKENLPKAFSERKPISVPSAIAHFPNEIIMWPKMLTKSQHPDLVQYTRMARGGHFAAFEEPLLLAKDIESFVQAVRKRSIK